jgi:exopolyphosphatase / guanosine-5'-triphosphate,3'-diphosphate pyrophosphatase
LKYAAIDIGTNAARLLVGEVSQRGEQSFVKKISYARIPLRLGFDVFENGCISNNKAEDLVKTIQAFRLLSEVFEVQKIRACATSAMREATNGLEIIERIRKETKVPIEIISGEEEAGLIFETFLHLNFDKSVPFVVIDVGGGSTEISVFEKGKQVLNRSFEIGTIRLLQGKVKETIWRDIQHWIANQVDLGTSYQIFATGGNINKVHKIVGGKQMGAISTRRIKDLRNEINELSIAQRVDKFQFKLDRADVIVPALDIYLFIMKELKCKSVTVPKIGLADGMIYKMSQEAILTANR